MAPGGVIKKMLAHHPPATIFTMSTSTKPTAPAPRKPMVRFAVHKLDVIVSPHNPDKLIYCDQEGPWERDTFTTSEVRGRARIVDALHSFVGDEGIYAPIRDLKLTLRGPTYLQECLEDGCRSLNTWDHHDTGLSFSYQGYGDRVTDEYGDVRTPHYIKVTW